MTLEKFIFSSRWVRVLFFLGLIVSMAVLLISVFSGYENFVPKLSIGAHEDRPAWMDKVGFSDLKMKLR
ncbi:MAG: YqhA family protein [Hydrogenophaga sp.]|uniref:YqhA family protein n=1 Tax=Hydrogenophaga sp. TaxID=1904254 RepID=UPI00271EFF8D|nr:YqhA family protein [Hydrogenophaga sp.]MDO9480536.1 YqhA family protein [Hydrogenophaga sp.]MDO9604719.1 YqhA family protein [Hydrogenophaga sp.]MDP3344490.1 YqhA family protein [Hydrogenophaga sp.]MDP3376664.1 YqhA family protein [Hydrogenophaga sp.]MDP3807480.1 YqhA family protein [Hydrogenophaga sp.]